MNKPDTTRPRAAQPVIAWLGCLSDETRLRLLSLLQGEELGVAELCEVLQLPQSTVSRHLKVLADQGWVHNRRQGTANLYQMDIGELDPDAAELWALARKQTEGWATLAQDRLRLQQSRRRINAQAFFADAAGHWPAMRSELYGDLFLVDAVIGLLPPHWTVVDLGCGTGEMVAKLADEVDRVIGVDQSAEMLEGARSVTHRRGNIQLVNADLDQLPLDDDCCDAALMSLVLSYLPHPDRALAEMARILRPGGKAVVVDLMRHDREDFRRQMGQLNLGFEAGELADMLADAGLDHAHCRAVAPQPQAKGPALLLASGRVAATTIEQDLHPSQEIRS